MVLEIYPVDWKNNLTLHEFHQDLYIPGQGVATPINVSGKGILYTVDFGTPWGSAVGLRVILDGVYITLRTTNTAVDTTITATLLYKYGNTPLFKLEKYDTSNNIYKIISIVNLPFKQSLVVQATNSDATTSNCALCVIYALE